MTGLPRVSEAPTLRQHGRTPRLGAASHYSDAHVLVCILCGFGV
jgi:hypothetical protein